MLIFSGVNYKHPGGAENLIFNIVAYLHIYYGEKSMVIGSKDSYLFKRLCDEKVDFIFCDENEREYQSKILRDDLLILFSNNDNMWRLKRIKCRVVVWNILSPSILRWNRLGIEKRLTNNNYIGQFFTRKLIVGLEKKSAFVCMDGSTASDVQCFSKSKYDFEIWQVPVNLDNYYNCNTMREREVLCVSYIGRGDDIWKIKPAKKIAHDLSLTVGRKVELLIYTTEIDLFVKELSCYCNNNFSIKYIVGLHGKDLRENINSHSDIHFAMGTSVLEGVLAGVPSILIDASYSDFPEEYKYKWIYESINFSLGKFIDYIDNSDNDHHFNGMTMNDVISAAINEECRVTVFEKCQEYVFKNHACQNVVDKIRESKSTATIQDVSKFTVGMWNARHLLKLFKPRNFI